MKYLVSGSAGPGFDSPEDALHILQDVVIPSFEELIEMEKKGRILGGGLPVGERSLIFIVEAASNEELDELLRGLPMWGSLEWDVVALQSFRGRADIERDIVKQLKG